MRTIGFTAKAFNSDEDVAVIPTAVFDVDTTSTIYIVDRRYHALRFAGDGQWFVDSKPGNYEYAERVDGIVGEDDDEWEGCANDKLADYGLRLGEFDDEHCDRYFLVAM